MQSILGNYDWQLYRLVMTILINKNCWKQQEDIMLTKEEILEKSRIENKNRDEMENAVFAKAGLRACAVGGIVCARRSFMHLFFMSTFAVGNHPRSLTYCYKLTLRLFFNNIIETNGKNNEDSEAAAYPGQAVQ